MDPFILPSHVVENNVKIYPFARKPSTVGNPKWPIHCSISSRSASSPNTFLSNTLMLEQTSENKIEFPEQADKCRVVSSPEYLCASQRNRGNGVLDLSAGEGNSSDEYEYVSFSTSSDSIEFTLNADSHIPTFPNITVSNTIRDHKKEKLPGDEDWLTWTTSPPRPIPALHGPASLPYARCPSGAEGTIIEEPSLLPHVIWGLEPNDTFGFQYSQNVRKKYTRKFSNHNDSIYATQNSNTAKSERRQELKPDDFARFTPISFDSPMTYDNFLYSPTFDSNQGDSNIHMSHATELTTQYYPLMNGNAYSTQSESVLGFRAWSNAPVVEPLLEFRERPSMNPNYLPTPPNSSSPQWSTTFSPPSYSSFLIPLTAYDTHDSQAMMEYTSTLGTSMNNVARHSEPLNTFPPAVKAPLAAAKGPKSHGRRPTCNSRGNLKTVIETEEDSAEPELQPQSARESFTSEGEEKPIVSLPRAEHTKTSFEALRKNPLYQTVHPSKFSIRLKEMGERLVNMR